MREDSTSSQTMLWLRRPRGALAALALLTAWGAQARDMPEVPKMGRVSLVPIHGEVDRGLAAFVVRVLGDHRKGELVVFELNTLGGELEAALSIRDALLASKATTLCWVHPRAISAGALISLACDVVAMAPGSLVGAATPVLVGMGDPKVDEKVASYMRQEMASTALAHGRPENVARAMVDGDVVVPGVNEKGKLVTLDAQQALALGVAELEAASLETLWEKLGRDPPLLEKPQPTGAETVAAFLSNPPVAMLLMVLGLLGLLIELTHPHGGLGIVVGLTCIGLFFMSHELVNLAGWEEILMLVAGLALIAAEYFAPGHGVFAVIGVHLVLASLFLALLNVGALPLSVAWHTGGIPRALASVFGSVLVTFGLYLVAVRYLPDSQLGKKLILDFVPPGLEPQRDAMGLEALVGHRGIATTDLRPEGKVEVINRRAEARLVHGFLDVGGRVRVVGVDGRRVMVEAYEADDEGSPE